VSSRSSALVGRSSTLLGLLLASASACTGAEQRPGRQHAVNFARADVQAAQRSAPDLFARAERAHEAALASDDDDERAEHAERARSWLAAAVAEHRRIELMRATSAAEARVVAAEMRRAELERARTEIERAAELATVAARACEQLAWALQRAEADALGDAVRGRALDEQRAQAAEVLRGRARIVLAAAVARQLPAERAAAVAAELAPRAGARTAIQRLADASDALARAERALGEARALSEGPSRQERAALLELAHERGLTSHETERGVVFPLPLGQASAQLDRDARIWSRRIAAVLRAHPHGPVQLEVVPRAGASAAARRSAAARGERLAAVLAASSARERVSVHELSAGSNAALVLPAYAAQGPAPTVPPGPQACLSPAHAPAR
jgi:hypothetical protein